MKSLEHFKNLGQMLSKTQQKEILGSGGGDTPGDCVGQLTCDTTGCLPNFDTSGTCEGKDGCTYSYAHSC